MRIRTLSSLLVSSLVLFAGVATAANVDIWGATTPQKRLLEPGSKACKEATGIDVKILASNTGKGMLSLIDGKVQVASIAEELKTAVISAKEAAKEQSKDLKVPDNLVFHKLFDDVIVPIIHKDNPVKSLTWDQLKDLYTGKVKNWKEVGGPDMPVRVVAAGAGDATSNLVQKQVMDGAGYAKDAIIIKNSKEAPPEVSKFKGGISALSEGVLKLNPVQTKEVKSKPISRPCGLVTVGKPSGDVAKVIEFYQGAGQKYLQ